MPGTGGLRKVGPASERSAAAKRGGVRAYRLDLTTAERRQVAALVKGLKKESFSRRQEEP